MREGKYLCLSFQKRAQYCNQAILARIFFDGMSINVLEEIIAKDHFTRHSLYDLINCCMLSKPNYACGHF